MTLREVAAAFAWSERQIWREISRGHFPKPVTGRPARFFKSDVAKRLNDLREERDKANPRGKAEAL